jgi:hypothetical protein
VFCVGASSVGAIEAEALPASANAPATPTAVTAFLRSFDLEVCLERDIVKQPYGL